MSDSRRWTLFVLGCLALLSASAIGLIPACRRVADSPPTATQSEPPLDRPSPPSAESPLAVLPPLPAQLSSKSVTISGTDQPLRREALDLADRVLQDFPHNPDALCVRGLVLDRYGENVEAMRCWEECLRLAPEHAAACERIGLALQRRGQYEAAAGRFRKALELEPSLPDARLRLAESLTDLGRADDAISVLKEHIARWPQTVEGRFLLGQAYLQRRAYAEAKPHYETVVENDPVCTPAYYALAMISAELGDREKAGRYRAQFEKLKRNDMAAQKKRRREHDDSVLLRRTLAAAYSAAARLYAAHGNPEKAETCFRKAALADPRDSESRNALVAMLEQHRPDEALSFLVELAKLEPDRPEGWVRVGALRARLKQPEAAEEAFRKAIGLAPNRPDAYRGLVQLYLTTRRSLTEAKILAQKTVDLEPSGEDYFLLSAACLGNGDRPGARTAIERAIEKDPGNPKYREALRFLEQKAK